jgi:hypothetical protein
MMEQLAPSHVRSPVKEKLDYLNRSVLDSDYYRINAKEVFLVRIRALIKKLKRHILIYRISRGDKSKEVDFLLLIRDLYK